MKKRPVMGIAQKTEGALLIFSDQIYKSMDGNLNFPAPTPKLTMLKQAYADFAAAVAGYERGNARKTLDKSVKREALESTLSLLRGYVEITANGDEDAILSSGFDLSKEPEPKPVPAPVHIQKIVDNIHSGCVVVQLDPGPKGQTFTIAFKPDGEGEWKYDFGKTRRDIEVNDLEAGKYYFFKITASNAAGNSDWSPEVRFLVR